jgi:DNA polymerase/3'-5' exonuclease PolX
MNENILGKFNELIKQIEAEYLSAQIKNDKKEMDKHFYRLKQFKRIITIIKNYPDKITSSEDVSKLDGIGKGTLDRIQEILDTGTLKELKTKTTDDAIKSMMELQSVIGIGKNMAKNFILNYKIKSVKELIDAHNSGKIELNKQILMGLKYYNVLKLNIPREETDKIYTMLLKVAHKIDDDLEVIICGSYRRGKPTSGDIDVLLMHPNVKYEKHIKNKLKYEIPDYLNLFIKSLTNMKFILDNMTSDDVNTKYMGFCQYKSCPVRRIDIRFMPYISYHTSTLYFTGPELLNQYMRDKANKLNLFLNEYGLYKKSDDTESETMTRIKINSEKDVFKHLHMKYLSPEQREGFIYEK